MPILTWSDDLKVGHPTIDADHRKLVDLINHLHDAMSRGEGREMVGDILDDLHLYTRSHFAREEQIQRQTGFPDHPAHRREHEALILQISDLRRRFEKNDIALTLDVMRFLRDWLKKHILERDRAIVVHLERTRSA